MKAGTYAEIEERMLEISKLKTTTALAAVLEITPQAMANGKKKGKMPPSNTIKFAELFDCSVDYLLTGEGEKDSKEEKTLEVAIIKLPGEMTLQEFGLTMMAQDFDYVKLDLAVTPRQPAPPVPAPVPVEPKKPELKVVKKKDTKKPKTKH